MKRAILRFALLTMAVALFAACTKNDSGRRRVRHFCALESGEIN